MKIAIVSNYKPDNETGAAKVTQALAYQLAKKHSVLFLHLGRNYQTFKKDGISHLQIPAFSFKQADLAKITPTIIRKVSKTLGQYKPQIIHSQNMFLVDLVALAWAKKNHVPFVVTFHCTPSEGIFYIFPKLSKNKIIKVLKIRPGTGYIKKLLQHVDLFIAPNQAVKQSVKKLAPGATKIKIINNGIFLDDFYRLPPTKPRKRVHFLYLGSYLSRKNQEFLVKTFQYLPTNFILSLYGNKKTGKTYVAKLQKIIKEKKIENVKINNFLNQKGVIKVLKKTHFFVSASLKEAQSLVIIEALASGTPVIALENETTKELVNRKNGLVLPQETSPEIFAQKLNSYVKQAMENYSVISDYCRQSVAKFDLEQVAERILSAYQEAIKINRQKAKIKAKIKLPIPFLLKDLFNL
jgi:1,2-diacylglycerol 3-alpha-glucosyltransferase